MKPREMFGLANRIVGLIVALYGVDWMLRFWLGQLGYFKLERTDMAYYLIMGIGYLSVGTYFLRGASHFVRFAYGDEEEEEPQDDICESAQPDENLSSPEKENE